MSGFPQNLRQQSLEGSTRTSGFFKTLSLTQSTSYQCPKGVTLVNITHDLYVPGPETGPDDLVLDITPGPSMSNRSSIVTEFVKHPSNLVPKGPNGLKI